jgi:cytochrome P450
MASITSAKKHGVPPGPPVPSYLQYAVAGLWVGTGSDPAALRLVQRVYGDMFSVPVPRVGKWFVPGIAPFKHLVLVGSPELVKQVFAADPETLHFGEPNPLGRVIGRNSLFSLDEGRHLERRRIVLPPFHGERMHRYESIVEEETLREIQSWPEGHERRTTGPMMRITLNVILRAVFGVRDGWMMDELRERTPRAVKLGQRLVGLGLLQRDLGPGSPGRRFKELIERFEWGVNALIDQARRDPELEQRTDVLALFARATHEDDGSLLSDQEIADQLKDVVAAGHETTANSMAWTIERLRRHPHVLRRLVEEAEGDGKELREATIREVQRTRPVIPGTGRFAVKPFELGDYVLPPGTVILLAAPLLHTTPTSTRSHAGSTPTASSASAPIRTPGSHSEVACAAAPARRSPTWRWTSCCGRCSATWRSFRRPNATSGGCSAGSRSPRPRADAWSCIAAGRCRKRRRRRIGPRSPRRREVSAPRLRSPLPGVHLFRKLYGDMFTVSLPGLGKAVVVADPDLIKQVFAADEDTLHFGERGPFGAVLGPNSPPRLSQANEIPAAGRCAHRSLL